MAARNFTGSARVRAAGSKAGARKISANHADDAVRMGDIRAGITASIEWPDGQSVGMDADVSATLHLYERKRFPFESPASIHARRTVLRRADPIIRAEFEAL